MRRTVCRICPAVGRAAGLSVNGRLIACCCAAIRAFPAWTARSTATGYNDPVTPKGPAMKSLLLAAAAALLLAGCAATSQDTMAHGPVMHHAGMSGMSGMGSEQQMQAMQQMHEKMHEKMHGKMAGAGTPAERQALMQEHMQECMTMMHAMQQK